MRDWLDYPAADDGLKHTVTGEMKVLPEVWSPQLGNRRDILVHLPPSYATGERRYPVLYMQDGQNLFDRATSFAEEWGVDRTMMAVAKRDGVEAIVVGIPNVANQRIDEYSPFADRKLGGGRGNHYLEFVLDTVKPRIDASFRTITERGATGVIGSSMGGLISLYAYFRYPDAIGFAGAMSPALWFAERAIFAYLAAETYSPGRLYIDAGTLEGPAEVEDVTRLRELLVEKGYRKGRDLLAVIEKGGRHDERAWGRRFRKALPFLLGSTRPARRR
jgi:predicted alpha/beta superfamily hydrolase